MQAASVSMQATAVNGQRIPVLGVKRVQMRTWGGILLQVPFCVMAVAKPLLSVGLLRRRGYDVHLSDTSCLAHGDRRVPLVESESLFYLPVLFGERATDLQVGSTWWPNQAVAPLGAASPSSAKWHLMEWACEEDSRLTTWFERHGQTATRLRLPEYDLRTYTSARRVVTHVRELVRQGRNVLVWAA